MLPRRYIRSKQSLKEAEKRDTKRASKHENAPKASKEGGKKAFNLASK